MYLRCLCGQFLSNSESPNVVEHFLVSDAGKERLQNAVDGELSDDGEIDMWPEHWEDAGVVDVWRCPVCERLYLNASGPADGVVVYRVEKRGLEGQDE